MPINSHFHAYKLPLYLAFHFQTFNWQIRHESEKIKTCFIVHLSIYHFRQLDVKLQLSQFLRLLTGVDGGSDIG